MTEVNTVVHKLKFFKACASKYLNGGELDNAVKYCELSARLAYIYNIQFSDDELESMIGNISDRIIPDDITYTPIKRRIVFYDSFASSRVLSIQYLKAIISWNYELLYITPQKEIGDDILTLIARYAKSNVVKIDCEKSFQDIMKEVILKLEIFKPQYVFLHLTPWDVRGVCIINKIKNAQRYLINLTDHSFWLGKICADYFFEYRNYGCYISQYFRKIPSERLLFQPFYPLISEKTFQGFPIVKGDKVLAFTGSSFCKMYGKNGLFLEILKDLVFENENVTILIAGDGNDRPLKAFIKKHNLNDRLIIIGNRADIDQVIRNIDIFINTYPFGGGLMLQLAALNNKPIIGFANGNEFHNNDIEDFFNIRREGVLMKTSIGLFKEYFTKLVESKEERAKNVHFTKNCIVTPNEFNRNLHHNLIYKIPKVPLPVDGMTIDQNAIFDLHFDIESNFIKSYKWIIWDTVKTLIIKDDFLFAMKVMWWKFTSKVFPDIN